ncbi:hypothetical protein FACS1894123_01770 [Bacteroidia bacterium]|nr:hypothetical protein FACS1894123_01770 [Bacteroidia bacterium]
MKRIGILLFCFIWGFFSAYSQGGISFNETTHDFGTIGSRDGRVSFDFILTNNTEVALLINNVSASCGCTVPTWTKEPIPPGKTGNITVTFDPSAYRTTFEKRITVYTSKEQTPLVLLIKGTAVEGHLEQQGVVKADVKKPLYEEEYPMVVGSIYRLKSKDLNFGQLEPGEEKTIRLEVFNNSDKAIKQKLNEAPNYLKVLLSAMEIPPRAAATIDVTIDTKSAEYGNHKGNITLQVDGVAQTFPYSVSVLENFAKWTASKKENAGKVNISTIEINFGNMSTGNSRKLKLSNSGKNILHVKNIQSTDPLVKVSEKSFDILPGEIVELQVSIDTKKVKSVLSSQLVIYSDDPSKPVLDVAILAKP